MKKLSVMLLMSVMMLQASFKRSPYDLTLVGQISFADGLGRLPIGVIDSLTYDLYINHVPTPGHLTVTDTSLEVQTVLGDPCTTPGNVALLFDILWAHKVTPSAYVPEESYIKIAYSMLEGSTIPTKWVEILNTQFDAVAVPDVYFKEVYTQCGVEIPIFVLPHGIYIETLLAQPLKRNMPEFFVFGTSAAYWPRKNYETLIQAFIEEFGNDPQVKLRLHGRTASHQYFVQLKEQINSQGIKNIELRKQKLLHHEYENFLKSLDCYVLISKGEGFSVTPREALALGIPCILSENSAHKTIVDAGVVCPVPADIEEPAYYSHLGTWGTFQNCSVKDVRKALRDVYANYERYLKKSAKGREWVKQFTWSNLKNQFLTLIKPSKVVLGSENIIGKECIITTSECLYAKYCTLINSCKLPSTNL